MVAMKIWLDVPFAEKDEAKALGARWDQAARRWYAPRPGMAHLDRWQALPDIPDLLPGEDRSFGSGLFVDLVPSSCWFTNVRSCVSARDWERLRRMIINRAGHRCEVCHRGADRDARRWLEAHERWAYDENARVQVLRRLICLCTDCHTTTHYGLARLNGKDQEAFNHLCAVTQLPPIEANRQIAAAFELWHQRSRIDWELDLSNLDCASISVTRPPTAQQRPNMARKTATSLLSAWREASFLRAVKTRMPIVRSSGVPGLTPG
jgi:hypothetical protein